MKKSIKHIVPALTLAVLGLTFQPAISFGADNDPPAAASPTTQPTGSIQVTVTDNNGQPVQGARIDVLTRAQSAGEAGTIPGSSITSGTRTGAPGNSQNEIAVGTASTDANGMATLAGIPCVQAAYILIARSPDGKMAGRTTTVVHENQPAQETIKLQPDGGNVNQNNLPGANAGYIGGGTPILLAAGGGGGAGGGAGAGAGAGGSGAGAGVGGAGTGAGVGGSGDGAGVGGAGTGAGVGGSGTGAGAANGTSGTPNSGNNPNITPGGSPGMNNPANSSPNNTNPGGTDPNRSNPSINPNPAAPPNVPGGSNQQGADNPGVNPGGSPGNNPGTINPGGVNPNNNNPNANTPSGTTPNNGPSNPPR